MRRLVSWISIILLAVACMAYAQQKSGDSISLPKLDGDSAKGLEIKCSLVKRQFMVGDPVNVWCTIRNTTNSIKPIVWHSLGGMNFCLVSADHAMWEGGLLPTAIPLLDQPIMIKSVDISKPIYLLFVPAHESIRILLTHKPDRPLRFKGRIVYDPLAPRGEWGVSGKDGPPWRNELVSSNEFEYEVVTAGAK